MKLFVWSIIIIACLCLLVVCCPDVHGYSPGQNYANTTGLTCATASAVAQMKDRRSGQLIEIRLAGTIIGGGKEGGKRFYDLRALDKTVIRCSWPFTAKLTKGQEVVVRGTVPRVKHMDAIGLATQQREGQTDER